MPNSTCATDATVDVPTKKSLKQLLLDAAVAALIELGVARTTTVEVQRRAGVSRGALLHHFPSHTLMLSATIEELVRRNDGAVRLAQQQMAATANPLERAIRTLVSMGTQPAFLAELELWATARSDAELLAAVQGAERNARKERERVIAELFASVQHNPNYEAVVAISIEFVRGVALSSVLTSNSEHRERLIRQWVWAVETLLQAPSPAN